MVCSCLWNTSNYKQSLPSANDDELEQRNESEKSNIREEELGRDLGFKCIVHFSLVMAESKNPAKTCLFFLQELAAFLSTMVFSFHSN